MAEQDLPDLAARLRAERQRRGLSLRGLAGRVGVSASMISQVEMGRVRPSVSTLYALTTALAIPLESVFTAEVDDDSDAAAGAGGDEIPGRHVVGDAAGHRLGPLVRPTDRPCLTLETGVTWERLGRIPGQDVDFLLITYPAGGASSSNGGSMRHSGNEYGYLISGELVVTLGFEEVRMAAGDSISFPSDTPHRYRNVGAEPAVGVWYVSA